MARKTKIVTVEQDGRDKGKVFLITEMPASQGERWATRAFLALANAGIDIPQEAINMGMSAIAIIGIQSLARVAYKDAEPLLDEMMACVKAVPDPSRQIISRELIEEDIEEVFTRVWLRGEVFELHTGFSVAAAISASRTLAAEAENNMNSNITETSLGQSVQ